MPLLTVMMLQEWLKLLEIEIAIGITGGRGTNKLVILFYFHIILFSYYYVTIT